MSELPFDTRTMKAGDAVAAVAALDAVAEVFVDLIAQESDHPKKPRKSVLDALGEAFSKAPLGTTPDIRPEPEPEDEQEEAAPEEAEAEDAEGAEEGPVQESDEEAGSSAAAGQVVQVRDAGGVVHEAVVVDIVQPDVAPLIVCIKDGTDETIMVTYDAKGTKRMSWSLLPE